MNSFSIIISSVILSIVFILFFYSFFLRKNIVDIINDRSSHNSTATRSGGLAVFMSLFLISVYCYINSIEIFDYSLFVPISLMLCVGLYDDIYNLDFKLKFIFQIIAAKIIIDNGLIIDNLHGILGIYELNRIIAQMITIFFIVAIINSINFIDGIDGLAISIIILFMSLFEMFSLTQSDFLYLSIITISSLIPLYYFNFSTKKKVFLGDSGSLFLGTLVSVYVIYILSNNYIIKPEFDLHKILFVISILFYPIVDIVRVFFLRLSKGMSPFKADKNHIHHLIINKTQSHWKSTLLIILSSFLFLIFVQLIF
tara:strand:- start:4146 stop:5081 length:936 start_codon:yes stop_codon:yes gene_type:complete